MWVLSPISLLFSQVLLSPLPPNAPWSATMQRPPVCPSSALHSLAHSPPPGDGTGSARRPTLSRACTAAESPEPRPLTPPTESRLRCGHANPASPSVTLRGSDDRGAEEQAANSEEPLADVTSELELSGKIAVGRGRDEGTTRRLHSWSS